MAAGPAAPNRAETGFAAAQQAMVRGIGNYKRGNERAAHQHPRNRA